MNNRQYTSCALDIPYPEIDGLSENFRLANMLIPAYIGIGGELAAISDYIYQNIIFEEYEPEVSEVLSCIAVAEMHHFRILGRMIHLLGNNPVIRTSIKTGTVDTRHLSNRSVVANVLQGNIRAEKFAIKTYRNIVRETDNLTVSSMLERIIADEELHIKLFEDLLNI